MVTVEDMNGAVKAALDGAGAALPGGGWSGSGPETPLYPYAMFVCVAEEPELTSGPLCFQKWRVTVAVYVPVGLQSTYSVSQILNAVTGATCVSTSTLYSKTFRNPNDRALHAVPADTGDEPSPVAYGGRDVLILTVGTNVLVQSDRSVP